MPKISQKELSQRNNNKLKLAQLFICVLLVSTYLRFKYISFGLPYLLVPGEIVNMTGILYLSKDIPKYLFSSDFFNTSPLFLFLNSILVFFNTGTFNINSLLEKAEFSPEVLYLPLRQLSAVLGIGSIVTVYFIGSIFSPVTAILASAFISVSLLHVKFSQVFLSYSSLCFFSLLSTLFVLKAHKQNNFNFIIPSIIFAFISSCINLCGLVSLIPILIYFFLNKEHAKPYFIKLTISTFLILFIVFNLNIIIPLLSFIKYLIHSYIHGYQISSHNSYLFYTCTLLPIGVGPVVYFANAALLFKYKDEHDMNILKILFSFPLMCLAFFGLFHLTDSGYGVCIVPYLCIGAAIVFASLFKKKDSRFLFIFLVLLALWIPLKYTLRHNKMLSLSDTRILATEWIRENTTDSYKVVWGRNSIQPNWHDVYSKNQLIDLGVDKEALVTKQQFIVKNKLLKAKSWFQQLRKKVDYVVVSSLDTEKIFRSQGHSVEKKYYSKFEKLKPIITFNPYYLQKEKQIRLLRLEELYSPLETLWQRERTGPLVEIYKL